MTFGYVLDWVINRVKAIFEYRRRKKVYPYYEKARKENTCNGPHKWDNIELSLGKINGLHTVCVDCGFISGHEMEYKLNSPALEVYKSHLKRKKERFERNIKTAVGRNAFLTDRLNFLLKKIYDKPDVQTDLLIDMYWKAVIETDVANEKFKIED